MSRLKIHGTIGENFISFAGGNIGAVTALGEMYKTAGEKIAEYLIMLDLLELYEDKIYMLWNDCCDRDAVKVLKILDLYAEEKISQTDIDERVKNVGRGKSFDDLLEDKENGTTKN